MNRSLLISCPSRLHFGLFSVGHQSTHQFGGVGLMVRDPRLEIRVRTSPSLEISGPESSAVRTTLDNLFAWFLVGNENQIGIGLGDREAPIPSIAQLPIGVEVVSLPPRHQGLGTGTQLALGTAIGVSRLLGWPLPSIVELAAALKRGQRSAIGSFGFFQGGILVDRGKAIADTISPLDFRQDFPQDWPILIVLDRKADHCGRWGADEISAFHSLPATAARERERLITLARDEIIAGLIARDYEKFGEGVYRFGYGSGLHFASVQGGPYHSESIAEVVAFIRRQGTPAVGQSSWGPGLFAIERNDQRLRQLSADLVAEFGNRFELIFTHADNQGVVVKNLPEI